MSQKTHAVITCAMGIGTGKNTLHLVGLDDRGPIVLREKLAAALANVPPCLIGIEAGMTTHYVARRADCTRPRREASAADLDSL